MLLLPHDPFGGSAEGIKFACRRYAPRFWGEAKRRSPAPPCAGYFTPPELHFVQANASAPVAAAFAAGEETVSPTESGGTIAYSIGNGDPLSGNRALAAARDTGGSVVAVTDEEIRNATAQFAVRAGACVEPASATTLAGVQELADKINESGRNRVEEESA